VKSLNDAGNYIRVIEERQGLKIGSIEEISWRKHWITSDQLKELAITYGSSEYGQYLHHLIEQS